MPPAPLSTKSSQQLDHPSPSSLSSINNQPLPPTNLAYQAPSLRKHHCNRWNRHHYLRTTIADPTNIYYPAYHLASAANVYISLHNIDAIVADPRTLPQSHQHAMRGNYIALPFHYSTNHNRIISPALPVSTTIHAAPGAVISIHRRRSFTIASSIRAVKLSGAARAPSPGQSPSPNNAAVTIIIFILHHYALHQQFTIIFTPLIITALAAPDRIAPPTHPSPSSSSSSSQQQSTSSAARVARRAAKHHSPIALSPNAASASITPCVCIADFITVGYRPLIQICITHHHYQSSLSVQINCYYFHYLFPHRTAPPPPLLPFHHQPINAVALFTTIIHFRRHIGIFAQPLSQPFIGYLQALSTRTNFWRGMHQQ